MTEEDAKIWLTTTFDVSRETQERLEAFVAFLVSEAQLQNLISAATLDQIWARHIVDSAQLLLHAPGEGDWLDLGSGAGFPGLIVPMLSSHRVVLVESRAKRIDFLGRAVELLGLQDVAVVAGMPLERLETAPYSVISARAFAPLPRLLQLSHRFSTDNTLWLLPKGCNAVNELDEVRADWNLDFTVEPSVTDSDAGIIIGRVSGPKSQSQAEGR
ncbi:MAG: 16S rRNA (guanine(527)-N(7))-methyltransferase RsmG [Sphingorhabdus sp.]